MPNFAWNCNAANCTASSSEHGYVPVIMLYTACTMVPNTNGSVMHQMVS